MELEAILTDPFVALLKNMEPIHSTPTLRTINGFGCRLTGSLAIPGVPGTYIAAHCLVALFIPLVPLGFYVMSGGNPGRFVGRIRWASLLSAFGRKAWFLAFSGMAEGILMLAVLIAALVAAAWLTGKHR